MIYKTPHRIIPELLKCVIVVTDVWVGQNWRKFLFPLTVTTLCSRPIFVDIVLSNKFRTQRNDIKLLLWCLSIGMVEW